MADLTPDAPLAALEDSGDDICELLGVTASRLDGRNNNSRAAVSSSVSDQLLAEFTETICAAGRDQPSPPEGTVEETFSGSLEDLVNSFDEKISKCFKNYTETTETLAPVQIRTQEEIMNECQIWWTLTGNFGNLLPIDWSKSYARKLHIPVLNLRERKDEENNDEGLGEEEDEELAHQLDMHNLIVDSLGGPDSDVQPQTAEEVIDEIDEIMQESSVTMTSDFTMESAADSMYSSLKPPSFHSLFNLACQDSELEAKLRETSSLASNEENLRGLSYTKLLSLQNELESMIQMYNESLVYELAQREELEFEKELKNTFISLLLSIQNKRRNYQLDRKRKGAKALTGPNAQSPQYLTAVVPYLDDAGPPSNATLQALIKVLRAINDDSSTTTTLLTDYILNVLCPAENASVQC